MVKTRSNGDHDVVDGNIAVQDAMAEERPMAGDGVAEREEEFEVGRECECECEVSERERPADPSAGWVGLRVCNDVAAAAVNRGSRGRKLTALPTMNSWSADFSGYISSRTKSMWISS